MQSLIEDSRYFAQVNLSKRSKTRASSWTGDNVTHQNVVAVVANVLGSDFTLGSAIERPSPSSDPSLTVYNMLTEVLPERSTQTSFFWDRFCRPYASLLQTSNYSLEVQCRFLIFLWARVIGFLGPETGTAKPTMLTQDGSTCEASWVIPSQCKASPGEATRSLRFAIQPTDPRNGTFLRGSAVMDYLTSEAGNLGIIYCPGTSLDWKKTIDAFLYGHIEDDDDIALESSGFYLGFGLASSGHIGLKAYFQPPFLIPNASPSILKCPIHVGDSDLRPLRTLVGQLHPTLVEPFDVMVSYLDSIDASKRPLFHMLAVDVVPNEKNRIKIYSHSSAGLCWQDIKSNFTMGDRLTGVEMDRSVSALESLWNHLFPSSNSNSGLDLVEQTVIEPGFELDDSREHPPGGVGYYYELAPASMTVAPKLYLPVRHWCKNDQFICDAVEAFYDEDQVSLKLPPGSDQRPGWLSREIARAFKHRALSGRNGIATWVTFGHKKKGWELTSYYSPEITLQEEAPHRFELELLKSEEPRVAEIRLRTTTATQWMSFPFRYIYFQLATFIPKLFHGLSRMIFA